MPRFSLFSRAVPDAVEAAAAACGSDEQIDPYKGVTEEIIKLTYAKKLRRLRLAALLQTAVEQDKLERARRLSWCAHALPSVLASTIWRESCCRGITKITQAMMKTMMRMASPVRHPDLEAGVPTCKFQWTQPTL